MNKTSIEWVKNPDGSQGYTWNPITGCLNCTLDGLCKSGMFPCYAYQLAHGRVKGLYLRNENIPEGYSLACGVLTDQPAPKDKPFYPRFWPERISCQFTSRKTQGVFVCDMADLFGIGIPENWTWQVLQLIKAYPQHRFYLLTKQPQNLRKWSPFPSHCYMGVTATNYHYYSDAVLDLANIEAKVKYLSLEPLLDWNAQMSLPEGIINWVIIGACTGNRKNMEALCQRYPNLTLMQWGKKWTAQPKIEWVQEITEACDKAGIPVFHKDNLKPIFPYPTTTLRQELPERRVRV